MPTQTRNAEFIDVIAATGKLTDDKIHELRDTDKRAYTGILLLERRRRSIEHKYGNCVLELICRSGNRHDAEGIVTDDLDELIPQVVGLNIKEVRVCVRCAAHIVETRDSAGRRSKVPIYLRTPIYEAIKDSFTCAEASALARIDRWEQRLHVIAKGCKLKLGLEEQASRKHLTLAASA